VYAYFQHTTQHHSCHIWNHLTHGSRGAAIVGAATVDAAVVSAARVSAAIVSAATVGAAVVGETIFDAVIVGVKTSQVDFDCHF